VPDLSIAVVSVSPPEILARCLDALVPQAREIGAEVIVVRRTVQGRDRPGVTWLDAAPTDTVPRMRAAAMRRASGRVIALLEDDCAVAPGWCRAVLDTSRDHPIAGGPIEPDPYTRALDWAVFYCEYARFLPPFDGEVAAIPGNNAAYSRALALEWLDAQGDTGFLDVFAHRDWRARGLKLWADGRMAVRNLNRWTPAAATRSAFHHGRAYAGQRCPGRPAIRVALALGSPLLPAFATVRTARDVITRGRPENSLPRALPWIIVFHTCWAAGELIGYLFGPGRSADRWQ
jgi:hypothetical protein